MSRALSGFGVQFGGGEWVSLVVVDGQEWAQSMLREWAGSGPRLMVLAILVDGLPMRWFGGAR